MSAGVSRPRVSCGLAAEREIAPPVGQQDYDAATGGTGYRMVPGVSDYRFVQALSL